MAKVQKDKNSATRLLRPTTERAVKRSSNGRCLKRFANDGEKMEVNDDDDEETTELEVRSTYQRYTTRHRNNAICITGTIEEGVTRA